MNSIQELTTGAGRLTGSGPEIGHPTGQGRSEAIMRIPFAVGRLKGDFTEIVLMGEDSAAGEVPFFRGTRMTRSPGRFRPQPRRNATGPA